MFKKFSNLVWKVRLLCGLTMSNALACLFVYGWYIHRGLSDYDLISNIFGFLCIIVALYDWTRFIRALVMAALKAHAEYKLVFRIERREVATATSEQI